MSIWVFIDNMTEHLVWPVIILVLALVFRRQLSGILNRIRKIRWSDKEAELDSMVAAGLELESAVNKISESIESDRDESGIRDAVEQVMIASVEWGYAFGKVESIGSLPELNIKWDAEQRPQIRATGPSMRGWLSQLMVKQGISQDEADKVASLTDYELTITGARNRHSNKFPAIKMKRAD